LRSVGDADLMRRDHDQISFVDPAVSGPIQLHDCGRASVRIQTTVDRPVATALQNLFGL